jgi:multidrug efflux pump subunit AcrA (membrane-fusion protein)
MIKRMNFKKHFRSLGTVAMVAVACIGEPSRGVSGSAPGSTPEPKSDALATHTLIRGAVKNKGQLEAVFEAVEMMPMKLESKAWTDLTVIEAVAHGAKVKKGDALVRIETQKLEEQISELEQDRPLAALTLELAEMELENLKESTPLKLETARRARRISEEDYHYFVNTNRVQRERAAKFSIKNAEQRLDYALEELAQLEKMYKADDLTEETEEIILKRQKFAVESARFSLDATRLTSARELDVALPRELETLKSQKRDQELAFALSEESLPRNIRKKTLEVEKLRRDQMKPEKRIADLKQDLANLTVRAPMDGVVYYGACENGRWTTGAVLAKKLVPGGRLSANEVFMTVLDPDKLVIKAVVPESELSRVEPGSKGQAVPTAAADKKLIVKVEEVGLVPLPGGGFEATLSVEQEKGVHLVPGMTCKLSIDGSQKAEIVVAPKEAVFIEGKEKLVYVAGNGAAPERRIVKTGESDDKLIEILEGATEGEKILLKKPEER